MKFSEVYGSKSPVYSFEFFPPKQEGQLSEAFSLIRELSELSPDFMTVTYGAGGGTRALTREMTAFIRKEVGITSVAHLTCVEHTVDEINRALDDLQSWDIQHVLALRGDPPKGQEKFVPHDEGFSCARDLTKHIRARGDFSIAVAGYPETHPDAGSQDQDIAYLKEKVEAGAEVIITQLFFDIEHYLNFTARAKRAGISVPIVPGIMPISNVKQLKRFTSMCGASIPERMLSGLEAIASDSRAVSKFGIDHAVELCRGLLESGAPGLHLYTLNKSEQVKEIVRQLSA